MGKVRIRGVPPFKDDFLARFRWIEGHADMLGLFVDGAFLAAAAAALAEPFRDRGVTKVAAVEARGFVLGACVSLELGAGFVAVRKGGSIHPGAKVEQVTRPDWRGHEHLLRLQRAALEPNDVVLLVDDWAEKGSQATAARALVEECGASYAGLSILVDELPADVRAELQPVRAVALGEELPPGG
jgi:adenine phosphoribosyltransferase